MSPDGSVATGPGDSALRAGQRKFDATGQLPCAQHVGQREGDLNVIRIGGERYEIPYAVVLGG